MALLENSVPIAGLSADDFDAIYIPGGHGVAVDGPFDLTLRALISDFAAKGKLVSAVCHGPVAFSGPEVNGTPLVAGKRVRGVPCRQRISPCRHSDTCCQALPRLFHCAVLFEQEMLQLSFLAATSGDIIADILLMVSSPCCCGQVTCFSNSEENTVGKSDVVPFMPESRLRELGGLYEKVLGPCQST